MKEYNAFWVTFVFSEWAATYLSIELGQCLNKRKERSEFQIMQTVNSTKLP